MRKSIVMMVVLVSILLSVQALATADYRLGAEDVVTVAVLRHEEFSGEFMIPQDGIVDLPAVGQVKATGMTIKELSDYITKGLSDRLQSPEVSVFLKNQGMKRVYVLGSVKTPGVYDYKPGWRIAECVAAAGGNLGEASDCEARLLKGSTGEQTVVKLEDVLAPGSQSNLAVEAGDVLSIESVRLLPVYVTGMVKNPGMYSLRKDGGLLEAIALSGGPLDTAAISKVTITHISGKCETVDLKPLMLSGNSSANRKLEPGDLVVVPESNRKIAVLGNVTAPGYFALRDGESVRLTDALAMAGGTAKQSNLDGVMVIGVENGKEKRQLCSVTKFLKAGDLSSNPIMEPGTVVFVAKNGKADWQTVLSGLSVTALTCNMLTK